MENADYFILEAHLRGVLSTTRDINRWTDIEAKQPDPDWSLVRKSRSQRDHLWAEEDRLVKEMETHSGKFDCLIPTP